MEGVLFAQKEVSSNASKDRLEISYEKAKLFGKIFKVSESIISDGFADFESYFEDVLRQGLEVTTAGTAVGDVLISGVRFPYTLFGWFFRSLAEESLPRKPVQTLAGLALG